MHEPESIDDATEVRPRCAETLAAFELFRSKCSGADDLARHRSALAEIKRKTNGEISTGYVQRLVNRTGDLFETASAEASNIQFGSLRKIVAIIAPSQEPRDFFDLIPKGKKRAGRFGKGAPTGKWVPGAPTYPRKGQASFILEPQNAGDDLSLEVSIRLTSHYVKIPEGDGTPQLPAYVWVNAGEILMAHPTSRPVPESVLGSKFKPIELVTHDGVRWNFDNPRGANEHPLDKARLCQMRLNGAGPHRIAFTLRCRDLDLDVDFINPPAGVDSRNLATVRRLMQKWGLGDADYVELATADIELKEDE